MGLVEQIIRIGVKYDEMDSLFWAIGDGVSPFFTSNTDGPTSAYYEWAQKGRENPKAVRYPMGKAARPICSVWGRARLPYIEARKHIYIPLYRNAVRKTDGWKRLKAMHEAGQDLILWDFDGYDTDAPIRDVILSERKMGHAFVLKMMLLYGEDFKVEDILRG